MSHFTVLVIGEDIVGQLAPYHEFECTGEDNEYVQDLDITEEAKEEYEEHKKGLEEDEDTSFAEFVKYYHGIETIQFGEKPKLAGDHKYGYAIAVGRRVIKVVRRTNPNSKWDWYLIGGRWTGFFKAKAGAVGQVGEPGALTQRAGAGRFDSGLKKDIDIEGMKEEARKKAENKYDIVWGELSKVPKADRDAFVPWEEFRDGGSSLEEQKELYHAQPLARAFGLVGRDVVGFLSSVSEFLLSREEYGTLAANSAIVPYAVVKGGEWFAKGEMGWWGCSDDKVSQEEWNKQVTEMVEALPEDTLLSIVDCHT